MSSLVLATKDSCLQNMFTETQITGIDLSSLVVISGSYTLNSMCSGCTYFTQINWPSLKYVSGTGSISSALTRTALTSVSFPALTYAAANSGWNNFLYGVTGCTLHFPANLDPQSGSTVISGLTGYPNFGGTSTVLAFDLPSTFILTGANSVEYERNPKYDTATALGWRVKDTGTATNPTIDWTPYYTSGTTDPQVGDTIYSDDACTTAVTTISAVA
jgi:hypothetical protein